MISLILCPEQHTEKKKKKKRVGLPLWETAPAPPVAMETIGGLFSKGAFWLRCMGVVVLYTVQFFCSTRGVLHPPPEYFLFIIITVQWWYSTVHQSKGGIDPPPPY